MSGMTRSIPNISSSGNIRPQSMTTMSSPYSKTYMFLPISPTPPSGMMRSGFVSDAMGWFGSFSQKRVSWSSGPVGSDDMMNGCSAADSGADCGAAAGWATDAGSGRGRLRDGGRRRRRRDAARELGIRPARRGSGRHRRSWCARSPTRAVRRPDGTGQMPGHSRRRSTDRPAGSCRGPDEIRSPGMNRPSEWRPRVTTRAGSRISSWRRRYGAQAAISSGSGSRFSGGRHLTMLVMKTSSRRQPRVARNLHQQAPRPGRRTGDPHDPR